MNKFGIGVLIGIIGVLMCGRYISARRIEKELQLYENLDAGYLEEESR